MHISTSNANVQNRASSSSSASQKLVMGEILGRCVLPAHVTAGAARLADEFFTA
jgi:hypothetical protein